MCKRQLLYTVCTQFFKKTFRLGSFVFNELFKHSGSSLFPKEKLTPHHFSHYIPTSSSENVQCASSCLNWWKGPLVST
jgi:hypothetical protein